MNQLLIGSRPRSEEDIRRCVRDKSRTFFEWARDEMIPFWEDSRFSKLLEKLSTNVFERKKLELLKRQIKSQGDIIYDLFEVGLIGCALPDEFGVLIQRFNQNDPSFPVSKEDYKTASYLTIHPCVNLATRSQKKEYTANHYSVAGHGCPLHQLDQAKHVHFGAGNLGLGFVLPIVASNKLTCVCVIQRPSNSDGVDWASLNDQQIATLTTLKICPGSSMPERDKIIELQVISDKINPKGFEEALVNWQLATNNILLLTDSTDRIHRVLEYATSVSSSIKSNDRIQEIGDLVVNHGNLSAFYPFENDESAVDALEIKLNKNSNIKTIRTCSDRICTNRKLSGVHITVNTEDYYRLIVNDSSKYTKTLLGMNGADGHIVYMNDRKRFDLENEAKRLLVNGLHTFYAIDIIGNIYKKVQNKDELVFLLRSSISHILMTSDVQDKILEVADLFQIHLLSKAEISLGITKLDELLTLKDDFARIVDSFLTRVTTSPDQLSRIIRPEIKDVVKKYSRFSETLSMIDSQLRRAPLTMQLIENPRKSRPQIQAAVNAHLADMGQLIKYLGDCL